MPKQAKYFDQEYADWTKQFEALKRQIKRTADGPFMTELRRAGAREDTLFELLTMSVQDERGGSRAMRGAKERLSSLANQLVTVTNFAERVVKDPLSDGRFYLALLGGLPWDQVPKPGIIEAPTLKRMRDLAELIKRRAAAMGSMSRRLSNIGRTTGVRRLLLYVHSTTNKSFDFQIAWLLSNAHRVAGKEKSFTAEQIKKFRQRHLPETCKRGRVKSGTHFHPGAMKLARRLLGHRRAAASNGDKSKPKRKTHGRRTAEG